MRWALVKDDEPTTGDTLVLADEPPPAEVEAEGEQSAGRFRATLIVEDTWSGDGRFIEQDALSWRDLPLPLMGLDTTTDMHEQAVVVGRIDTIERVDNELIGEGEWANTPEAASIRTLVRGQHLRGVSADLDDVEYEIILPEVEEDADDGEGVVIVADAGDRGDEDVEGEVIPIDEIKMRVTSGRIMGATIVPFPAFEECTVEDLDPTTALTAGAVGPHDTGMTDDPWDGAAQEGKLDSPMSVDTARAMYAWFDDEAVEDGEIAATNCRFPHHMVGDNGAPGVANLHACAAIIASLNGGRGGTTIPADDRQGVYDHVAKHYRDNDLDPPELNSADDELEDTEGEATESITAAIHAPVEPPRAWFANPHFKHYTPLTILDDGQVFGHIADWTSCHISYTDRCVTPPRSASNYAHFHVGEVRCNDGSRVAVGHLTLKGGHAPLSMSASQAQAHYDDTRSCVADLVAGEDRYGLWVAGALRPGVSEADVRATMASGVSGDWRRIGGTLEMINVANVNTPGFTSPRVRVREELGLVASLIVDLPPVEARDDGWKRSAVERLAASIGRSKAQRLAALRKRVHPELVEV
jgi:hypothetical protein